MTMEPFSAIESIYGLLDCYYCCFSTRIKKRMVNWKRVDDIGAGALNFPYVALKL